eukprot:m.37066 g.37066  ORF g.37066 m.37066 type:complete len:689 (+) comp6718_c0_seq1:64-2130(+)
MLVGGIVGGWYRPLSTLHQSVGWLHVCAKRWGDSVTGLVGKKELATPDGFSILEKNCREVVGNHVDAIHKEVSEHRFNHSLEHLDHISNSLCKVLDLCEALRQFHPPGDMVDASVECLHSLGLYMEELNTDPNLYWGMKGMLSSNIELSNEARFCAESYMVDFEKSAIHLGEDVRKKVVEATTNIAHLGMEVEYLQKNSVGVPFYIPESYLAGVPPPQLKMLQRMENGDVIIPSYDQSAGAYLLTVVKDRHVRKVIEEHIYATESDVDTKLEELFLQRTKLAQMVGFEDAAHKALVQSLADTPATVNNFILSAARQIRPKLEKELATLEAVAKEQGYYGPIETYDVKYYSNLVSKTLNTRSEYFSLQNCFVGINVILRNLFGAALVPVQPAKGEVWHPTVQKYELVEMSDETGVQGDVIGTFYVDLVYRENKNNHPSHYTLQTGRKLRDILPTGELEPQEKPIITLVCGYEDTSALTFDQAHSLFHEFGHALHSLFSRTTYQHIGGTRGSSDFSELPSTLFEKFLQSYDVVKLFAKHPISKQPISRDVHEKLVSQSQAFPSINMDESLILSSLDQYYNSADFLESRSLQKGLELVSENITPFNVTHLPRYRRFFHLITYEAGYYSYAWCQALAKCLWDEKFEANPLSRENGERYREFILEPGSGGDRWKRIEDFLGRRITVQEMALHL